MHCRPASQKRQAEMNVLPIEKQIQIISALVEGNSIRATARMIGVEHKTVLRVLLRTGDNCARLLNERMPACLARWSKWMKFGPLWGRKKRKCATMKTPNWS